MNKRVIIVGGGVAGLTTAFELGKSKHFDVTLFEKSPEPGGRLRSLGLPGGYYADNSAQFYASNYRHSLRLMRQLKIDKQLAAVPAADFSGIYRDGKVCSLPATLGGLLTTDAFTTWDKVSLLRLGLSLALRYRPKAYVAPAKLSAQDDVQLAEFVRNRFGSKLLDEVVDPFVGMSMAYAEDVSLVFAVSMAPISLVEHFVFPKGNGLFTQRLAEACRSTQVDTTVRRIVVEEGKACGVQLEPDGRFVAADIVVCATPAHEAAPLLTDLGTKHSDFLARVPYSSCLQVLYGTDRPYLPVWGMVVPRPAGSPLSYLTEETRKNPARAPSGAGLTQAFIVGEAAKKMMQQDDTEVGELVFDEIRRLLPAYPKPQFTRIIRRPKAMVLSAPGYQRQLADFNHSIRHIKGLHLISDYQSNPLIEASVYLGQQAAQRIEGRSLPFRIGRTQTQTDHHSLQGAPVDAR